MAKWNMATRKSDTDIAESTIDRAKKRLKLGTPTRTGDDYYLPGLKQFGDAYSEYHLQTDGKGDWCCSCHGHYGGELRRERVCAHSAAVASYFNLPCHRTLPLKEKPEEKELEGEKPELLAPEQPTLDRPCDIPGIPPQYTEWRPGQRETVEWLVKQLKNGSKFSVLEAPTGSGKSLDAIAAVKLAGLKAIYIVGTRQLQQQLANDFPDAVIIWGRDHYPCPRFPDTDLTAADCTHRKHSPCPKIVQCPYKQQKRKALAADLVVTNYSFGLHEMNFVGGLSGRVQINDEGDVAEGEIMKFASLTLTQHQLEKCEIEPPKFKTKLDAWLEWVGPTSEKVGKQLGELEDKLEPFLEAEQEPPKTLMWELSHYQRLHSKLETFAELADETWVAELDNPEKWEFKPTFVRRFGHLLVGHAEKVLAMSATMLSARDWGWNLGIDDEIAFYRVPSTFPKEHRPVVYLPTADFSLKSANDESLALMVRMVDGLLDKHQDEKGIIHAISYKITRYLLEHSRHQDRLISHTEAGTRAEALQQLIDSDSPLVLVSPSFGRGVDLFGDRARFQICVKIPFADLGDKQTSKRRWSGKNGERWYLLETVRAIVQMAGRIVRSVDDHGTTYILDSRFERFFKQMKRDFPPWFSEAIIW